MGCRCTQLLVNHYFYCKYFFAVLEIRLEVCMLTSTREADRRCYYIRKGELGLAMLKPEQEMAISDFALGKDKIEITGSQCFLNCCEESDNLGSQGSLLQMKQGCSAIDQSTHAQQTLVNIRAVTLWRRILFLFLFLFLFFYKT